VRVEAVTKTIIPVLHNVSSVQRVVDMARLVYSLGLNTLVVTKAYGGAAQSGVPEAMRIALKLNARLIVLPELSDAVELFSPSTVIAVTKAYAEEHIDPLNPPVSGDRVMIVFSGGDPEFTPAELAGARKVYIDGVDGKLGPVAEAALLLYGVLRLVRRGSESG
jgi:SpoU rRNA methylase family enzyme